jgi:hypothetical protein
VGGLLKGKGAYLIIVGNLTCHRAEKYLNRDDVLNLRV